ncbi:hypothetical protein Q1695_016381 [Nippostrongylus brasiliensis]|nr:hypothetical protein Q1695_016381 [Nippostrongylus brasiliensis]
MYLSFPQAADLSPVNLREIAAFSGYEELMVSARDDNSPTSNRYKQNLVMPTKSCGIGKRSHSASPWNFRQGQWN